LAPLLRSDVPDLASALRSVRWVYAVVFLVQTALALVVGSGLVAVLGSRPNSNAAVAGVLLAMSLLHLPVGAALAWRVAGGAGRGAALAGATTAAVVLSVPAWIATLMAASGQRPAFVLAAALLVALAYVVGFLLTPRCAAAATRPLVEATAGPGDAAATPGAGSVADGAPPPGGAPARPSTGERGAEAAARCDPRSIPRRPS